MASGNIFPGCYDWRAPRRWRRSGRLLPSLRPPDIAPADNEASRTIFKPATYDADLEEARIEALEITVLRKVRALLATAESSEYEPEARAFAEKAMSLATEFGIEPQLLEYPRESLKVAVVMAELQRIKADLKRFDDDPSTWPTKTAEWAAALDEYDDVLAAAANVMDMTLPKLPYGVRRHLRPPERERIERMIWERVAANKGNYDKGAALRDGAVGEPPGRVFEL